MKRLYVFDMDGTLLPHTTAMLEIAKLTGHLEKVTFLEEQYLACQIQGPIFSKTLFDLWKALSPQTVEEAFLKAPKLNRIKEVLQMIKKKGNISCLLTSSQHFFAQHFYDYGFDFIFASQELCLHTGQISPEKALYAKDKLVLAKKLCQQLDLSFAETVAFGDSISDVQLFQNLTHTLSVNGDHHIHELASYHYRGTDLHEAFELLAHL